MPKRKAEGKKKVIESPLGRQSSQSQLFGGSSDARSRYVACFFFAVTACVAYRIFLSNGFSNSAPGSAFMRGGLSETRVKGSPLNGEIYRQGTLSRERVERRSSFLNNPKFVLSPHVFRPWMELNPAYNPQYEKASRSIPKPKVKLVLTDMGVNYHDQEIASRFMFVPRSQEILQGFIDHPYFDPFFSWSDMLEGIAEIDPGVTYIVLMDLETTFEGHYPAYNGGTYMKNYEKEPCSTFEGCKAYIDPILNSPLFKKVKTSHLVFFGYGYPEEIRKEQLTSSQITLASVSAEPQELNPEADMGFPPGAVNPAYLSLEERQQIFTCEAELPENRPYFFGFVGDERHGFGHREDLFKLNNNEDIIVLNPNQFARFQKENGLNYGQVAKRMVFGAVPRGHALYSYRFSEVLTAGAIPVILADNWVLPFRKELVDWSECAVVVPEKDSLLVIDILKQYTAEQRCKMRQKCLWIYENYMSNPENEIAGVVDSIVAMEAARGNL